MPVPLDPHKLVYSACGFCGTLDTEGLFKICGDCKSSYYCGQRCQRLAWPGHKANCKAILQKLISGSKKRDNRLLRREVKKWIQTHLLALQTAAVRSLDLETDFNNCFENAVCIGLKPHFDGTRFSFELYNAASLPLSLIRSTVGAHSPAEDALLDLLLKESRSIRDSGRGIGSAITILSVGTGELSIRVMVPHLLLHPCKMDLSYDAAWSDKLQAAVLM